LDSTSLQDCQQIDISQLITAVISENSLAIKRKKLQISYPVNQLEVRCNEKQLSVVIDNILSNAIKYSPIGGKISIDIRKANKQLILTIADQGTGIADQHVKQIFDAFYQGTAPQDNQIKGSGLGLTIVKELLMRINGSIKVITQTQAPSGTCIEISLPDGNR
jgi:two-component system sensor histidine kinase GlrK